VFDKATAEFTLSFESHAKHARSYELDAILQAQSSTSKLIEECALLKSHVQITAANDSRLHILAIPIIEKERVSSVFIAHRFDEEFHELVIEEYKALLQFVWKIDKELELKDEKDLLSTAIENSPISVMITDKYGTIQYINPYFTELTGYSFEEAVGQNPKILKSGRQTKEFYDDLWSTILKGKPWSGEIKNLDKFSNAIWENVLITPIKDVDGEIKSFVALKENITDAKKKEKKLIESLGDKEVLLLEVHHRVKNNLAIISALLQLEIFQTENEETINILNHSISRINTIAKVHEDLYQSDEFSRINLNKYLTVTINEIIRLLNENGDREIVSKLNLDTVIVNINQAVPVGLLVNEIIANSVNTSFHNRVQGAIFTSLKEVRDEVILTISDDSISTMIGNGQGNEQSDEFSNTLIQILCDQLNATISTNFENGRVTEITFKKESIAGIHSTMKKIPKSQAIAD
jgi:PAS domain S-box-containing protein